LAVEKLIHGAAHLLQSHVTLDITAKDIPGFVRRLKPLHANAGKRVLNFSFALYACPIKGCYSHLGNLLIHFYFIS
jgi:hypothetical protein